MNPQLLPTFKEIGVHMIFDIKLDGKFTRKARLVADGNKQMHLSVLLTPVSYQWNQCV